MTDGPSAIPASPPTTPDPVRLAELEPPARALPSFAPPPRFDDATLDSYRPLHPSQEAARERVREFALRSGARPAFRWPWQASPAGRGLYLDGGFGVGKTHLLAAAYHACPLPPEEKRYLSFQELVSLIGVLGRARARAELAGVGFWCIDEFELDDPGNTLIVKTFLSEVFAEGGHVVTTSNTPPEAQGRGRFNAEDFRREIQSVAERFDVVSVEGPDYRRRERLAGWTSPEAWARARREAAPPRVEASWEELFALLESVHPIRYGGLLEDIGTLLLHGVRPIPDQNAALRFVHFIDKLYDLRVGLRACGEVPLPDLFDASYREGAYAKKHHRCLSRLSQLLEE